MPIQGSRFSFSHSVVLKETSFSMSYAVRKKVGLILQKRERTGK